MHGGSTWHSHPTRAASLIATLRQHAVEIHMFDAPVHHPPSLAPKVQGRHVRGAAWLPASAEKTAARTSTPPAEGTMAAGLGFVLHKRRTHRRHGEGGHREGLRPPTPRPLFAPLLAGAAPVAQ
jgi:hypothetical protein